MRVAPSTFISTSGFLTQARTRLNDAMDNRHAVRLLSDMQTGINQIETLAGDDDRAQLILDGNKFDRLYRARRYAL